MSTFFSKYEHIKNHYQCKPNKYSDKLWIATEKIHGANYSFICDGTDVRPAKRSSELTPTTGFNNHCVVFSMYKDEVSKIYNEIKKQIPNCIQVQLYGELFGGIYNKITAQQSTKIQKGINYCEGNDFMAYDLKITIPKNNIEIDNTKTLEKTDVINFYYDFSMLMNLFEKINTTIKLVPIIKIDTLEELMKLNPKFESHVYISYRLEKINNNFAEGYVIKLFQESITNMDKDTKSADTIVEYIEEDMEDERERLIFKYKNPDFGEMVKNIKSDKNEKKQAKINIFTNEFKNYLTSNRADNIISKLNDDEEITPEMLYDDILSDFKIDNENDEELITIEEINKNYKACSGMCKGFLCKNKYMSK